MNAANRLVFDVARRDWLAGDPWLAAPAFPSWALIELVVVHWPGGDGVPTSGDPAAVDRFVRNQHAYSRRSRGYNLGYSASVDWLGRLIEIRGDTNRNAANAPGRLNARSVSVQVLTNLDGAMTPAQIAGVRRFVGQVLERAPRAVVVGHRDGVDYDPDATRTACPGDAIWNRVHRGDFIPDPDPRPDPDPQPEPDPPPVTWPPALMTEAIDMLILARENEPDTDKLRAFWVGAPLVGRRRLDRAQVGVFLATNECFDCGTGRSLAGAQSGDSITAVDAATMNAIIGPPLT